MRKRRDRTKGFTPIRNVLADFDWEEDKYISREFQKYGYELAKELNDLDHKALYIKLAKELPRHLLEGARNFVKDAPNVENPGKLFMWKLGELKKEWKKKKKKAKP